MSQLPLPEETAALLAKPNPAVITSLRPDGQPVSVATWYTALDDQSWSTHVSVQGRVTAWIEIETWHGWGAAATS